MSNDYELCISEQKWIEWKEPYSSDYSFTYNPQWLTILNFWTKFTPENSSSVRKGVHLNKEEIAAPNNDQTQMRGEINNFSAHWTDLVLSAPICYVIHPIQSTERESSMVINSDKLQLYLYVYMCVYKTGCYRPSFTVKRL